MTILRLLLILSTVLSIVPIKAGIHPDSAPADRDARFCDMGAAKNYFDSSLPEGPEGIWEFPEDHTRVAIVADRKNGADTLFPAYDIIVIDTPDCRLWPGMSIGKLEPTPLSDNFRLSLYRNRRGNILTDLTGCSARYKGGSEEALLISTPKIKFSLRPATLLPRFWRWLRLSVDNPADQLPRGLVRIYPLQNARKRIIYY